MKLNIVSLKRVTGASAALVLLMGIVIGVPLQGEPQASDPAAYYKAKCALCHGQKAEKKFDTTMADDQMVDAVLKGKKAEKPPNMPGFETKGVTADQAKALIAYMKELKSSAGQ